MFVVVVVFVYYLLLYCIRQNSAMSCATQQALYRTKAESGE